MLLGKSGCSESNWKDSEDSGRALVGRASSLQSTLAASGFLVLAQCCARREGRKKSPDTVKGVSRRGAWKGKNIRFHVALGHHGKLLAEILQGWLAKTH